MRRTALVALFAVALLAGCFGSGRAPVETTDTPTTPAATTTGTVPVVPPAPAPFAAVLVDSGRPGHEPVVAVAPSGSVFVHARSMQNGTAHPDQPNFNYLWRSRDGGATFERVGSADMERPANSEGTVAVLPTGRVLVAYSMNTPGTFEPSGLDRTVEIHGSDDDGTTWRLLSSIPLPSAHRTWIWPSGDIVHLGVMSYHTVFHWSSADGGSTWSGPNRVHDYNTYNGRLVGNGDSLLWPWLTGMYEQFPGDATDAGPWLLDAHVSTDGRAWVPYEVATLERRLSVFVGATVDANGTYYLAWAEGTATGSAVRFAWSGDGATWTVHTVAEGAGLRALPWVATPSAGRIGLVWYQNDDASGDPLYATGAWHAQYATVDAADTAAPVVNVTRPLAEPILDGPLCLQAFSCGDVVRGNDVCFTPLPDPVGDCTDLDHVRNYDDYVGLEYRDGKAMMAFVTTQGHGLPAWTPGDPGFVLFIREA